MVKLVRCQSKVPMVRIGGVTIKNGMTVGVGGDVEARLETVAHLLKRHDFEPVATYEGEKSDG